jgi:hypothetical protein
MTSEYRALEFCIATAVFICVWQLGWKRLALDALRQSIFRVRDKLFIDAAYERDGLTLDSEAYRATRDHLNNVLRFCHRCTAWNLFFWNFALSRREAPFQSSLEVIIQRVEDPRTRQRLNFARFAAVRQIFHYLLWTSPTLFTLVALGWLFLLVAEPVLDFHEWAINRLSHTLRVVERECTG